MFPPLPSPPRRWSGPPSIIQCSVFRKASPNRTSILSVVFTGHRRVTHTDRLTDRLTDWHHAKGTPIAIVRVALGDQKVPTCLCRKSWNQQRSNRKPTMGYRSVLWPVTKVKVKGIGETMWTQDREQVQEMWKLCVRRTFSEACVLHVCYLPTAGANGFRHAVMLKHRHIYTGNA